MKITAKLKHSGRGRLKKEFCGDNLVDISDQVQEFIADRIRNGKSYDFSGIWSLNPSHEIQFVIADLDGKPIPQDRPEPTFIVESSPGNYHCYWQLNEPIPANKENKRSVRVFQQCALSDPFYNANGELRIPGLRNEKRDCWSEWVKTNGPTYDARELLSKIIDWTPVPMVEPKPVEKKTTKPKTVSTKKFLEHKAIYISKFKRQQIDKKTTKNRPNRRNNILGLPAGERNKTLLFIAQKNYHNIPIGDENKMLDLLGQCYAHSDTTTDTPITESLAEFRSMVRRLHETHDPSKSTFDPFCVDFDRNRNLSLNESHRKIFTLVQYACEAGKGFIDQRTMAEVCGLTQKQVSRITGVLTSRGYIQLVKRGNWKEGLASEYRVLKNVNFKTNKNTPLSCEPTSQAPKQINPISDRLFEYYDTPIKILEHPPDGADDWPKDEKFNQELRKLMEEVS